MKRQLSALLLLALLAGCTLAGESSPTPAATLPAAETLTPEAVPALNIPLTDYAQAAAAPDFLTPEQQAIYRGAVSLYGSMFGGNTGGIDYTPFATSWESAEGVERDGYSYTMASGCYQNWADFDAAVHSVFTDDFWDSRNEVTEGIPIYRDVDGRLGYVELSRGSGYCYNDNFPDEFRLEEQSDDAITFTLLGHYSMSYPREGETFQDRDARLLAGYEYVHEFPIRMVKTGEGWRFAEFRTALADETYPTELESPAQVPFLGTAPDFDWDGYQRCRVMIADWFDYYAGLKRQFSKEVSPDCCLTGFRCVGENQALAAKAYLLSYNVWCGDPEQAWKLCAGGESPDERGNIATQVLLLERDGAPYGVRTLWETGLADMLKELEEGRESVFGPAIDPAEFLYAVDPIYEVSRDMIDEYLRQREREGSWQERAQQLGATAARMEMVSLKQVYERGDWSAKVYQLRLALVTEPTGITAQMEVGGCYPDERGRLRMEHNAVLVTVDDKPLKIVWWGSDNPGFERVLDRYESREDLVANLTGG